jgi:hypothetical protein
MVHRISVQERVGFALERDEQYGRVRPFAAGIRARVERGEARGGRLDPDPLRRDDGFSASPVRANPAATGGWGVYLVDELSSPWGVAEGDGTRVWFEVDR